MENTRQGPPKRKAHGRLETSYPRTRTCTITGDLEHDLKFFLAAGQQALQGGSPEQGVDGSAGPKQDLEKVQLRILMLRT